MLSTRKRPKPNTKLAHLSIRLGRIVRSHSYRTRGAFRKARVSPSTSASALARQAADARVPTNVTSSILHVSRAEEGRKDKERIPGL